MGSKGMADSTHVHTSLPAVRLTLGRNTGIVMASRLNHPARNRCGRRFSLLPIIGCLGSGLSGPIHLIGSCLSNISITRNRLIILRGIHFGGNRGGSSRALSGGCTTLYSIFMVSTFNATRHTRTSARNVNGFTSITYTNPLLTTRLSTLNGTLGRPTHPVITVINNSGMSAGLAILSSLSGVTSRLVINNNVTGAFVTTRNRSINGSLCRTSLISRTGHLLAAYGVPIPSSIHMTARFSRATPTALGSIGSIGTSRRVLSVNSTSTRRLTRVLGGTGAVL